MPRPLAALLLAALALGSLAQASPAPSVRVGALAFGTLGWELAIIRSRGLDQAQGIAIEATELASPEAGRIGLQGRSLDIVVSDWLWTARQRQQGQPLSFAPFSTSHGALVVPRNSAVKDVADVRGQRLGIAGGGLDKNWLLLKTLAQQTQQLDLEKSATLSFGAPPLLNQQLEHGQLDAVLTYWNYAAKLEAQGYRELLDGRQLQKRLGIDADVPVLGYVFREDWAKANPQAVDGFLKAAAEARQRICESDADWQQVVPLTREPDSQAQAMLRRHYCAGRWPAAASIPSTAAQTLFDRINAAAGEPAAAIPAGTFWSAPKP